MSTLVARSRGPLGSSVALGLLVAHDFRSILPPTFIDKPTVYRLSSSSWSFADCAMLKLMMSVTQRMY